MQVAVLELASLLGNSKRHRGLQCARRSSGRPAEQMPSIHPQSALRGPTDLQKYGTQLRKRANREVLQVEPAISHNKHLQMHGRSAPGLQRARMHRRRACLQSGTHHEELVAAEHVHGLVLRAVLTVPAMPLCAEGRRICALANSHTVSFHKP